jgi:beta-barrel assembly-enhancing protease
MKITPNQFAWIFLVVLVGLIGWGGYELYQFFKNPVDKIISIENEKKFGDMIAESTFSEANGFERMQDLYVDSCVKVIHDRLMTGLDKSLYQYEFYVVRQNDPNAFAIPGGKIFIHTGLIEFCKSPEELAAVLAHEMGHVEKRHTINNIVKQLGIDVVISFITNGGNSGLESISGQMLSNFFSREDESEADDFALVLLDRSRIRPARLGEVFSRMKHEHGDLEGAFNLLSTHPELESRAAKSQAYQTTPQFSEEAVAIDWQRLQNAVKNKVE